MRGRRLSFRRLSKVVTATGVAVAWTVTAMAKLSVSPAAAPAPEAPVEPVTGPATLAVETTAVTSGVPEAPPSGLIVLRIEPGPVQPLPEPEPTVVRRVIVQQAPAEAAPAARPAPVSSQGS